LLVVLPLNAALAQQKTAAEKVDSILVILPQLIDIEKENALRRLIDLTVGTPDERHYTRLYINEVRSRKNIDGEGWALQRLAETYYAQWDTDSVFIYAEEAIQFTQQHKLYNYLSGLRNMLIRRYQGKGQTFKALRIAEEAYEEAKALEDHFSKARILQAFGQIHYNLSQYEEATRFFIESIAEADQGRIPTSSVFMQCYDYLSYMAIYRNLPQECLRFADSMHMEIRRFHENNPAHDVLIYDFKAESYRARAYADLKQPEDALSSIRRMEAIYNPQWAERNAINTVMLDDAYGAYYHATGEYDKALKHLERLLNHYQNVSRNTGASLREKSRMAQIYFEKGDYRAAAEMYRQNMETKDSINNERFYAQTNELRIIYETDKAEMEIVRRQAEVERHRLVNRVLAIACVFMTLAAALLFFFYRQKQLAYRALVNKIQQSAKEPVIPVNHPDSHDRDIFDRLNRLIVEKQIYLRPDITLETAVQLTGISRNYISQAVNLCKGKNFTSFINEYRIKEAVHLLAMLDKTKYPIEEIGLMCGFNDHSTFYRAFKKSTGVSPSTFRKNLSINMVQH
jgi:AraC-like DNA-binding protein